MSTIVTVEKNDRDQIEKVITELGYEVKFYTNESSEDSLTAEINSDKPHVLWYLGRLVGQALTFNDAMKVINKNF